MAGGRWRKQREEESVTSLKQRGGSSLEAYVALDLHSALLQRIGKESDIALCRGCRVTYGEAAEELALLLRQCYKECDKATQNAMFNDVIIGLQQLAEMEGAKVCSAALSLLRAAEVVLPRQRRVTVVAEHKRAALIRHRQRQREGDSDGEKEDDDGASKLCPDTLLSIFRRLDVFSLASSEAVCRTWRDVAHEDSLWKDQFNFLFEETELLQQCLKAKRSAEKGLIEWRTVFTHARECDPRKLQRSFRVYCTVCNRFFWQPYGSCRDAIKLEVSKSRAHRHSLKPVSASEVVRIFTGDQRCLDSDESEEEEGNGPLKLWAVTKAGVEVESSFKKGVS